MMLPCAMLALAAASSVCSDEPDGLHLLQLRSPTLVSSSARRTEAWPTKGGSRNHSGYSTSTGPRDLSKPSWTFSEPGVESKAPDLFFMRVFHGSPIADGQLNVYIQSTTGWVYSVDRSGVLRWSLELSDHNPGNLALLGTTLYTCSQDGVAWAIDSETGKVAWSRAIGKGCPDDTYSVTAVGDTVLIPCTPFNSPKNDTRHGNNAVAALAAADGSTKWIYDMSPHNGLGYNQMHSIVGDAIYFSDVSGAAYSISLLDGSERWYSPGLPGDLFTTAGLVTGPNGMAYVGFSDANRKGVLRAHDLATGAVLWAKGFSEGVNAAPAVGPLNGRLAVVVAVGDNLECLPEVGLEFAAKHAQVVVLDATTGELIWSFDAPQWNHVIAGNTLLPTDVCCPDVWGTPTLASDGTVYANWSGGKLFALNDANGDGHIDVQDPLEYSSYHHGKGSNSATLVMPGLTVAAECKALIAYS